MASYIGLIHKDPDSDFGISFPDFPGCISAGTTLEEVRAMGAEALEFHIRGMLEDGDTIPSPSSLETIMADPENRDGLPVLIPVPDLPAIPVRIEVVLAPETACRLDALADRQGVSRAALVLEATRRILDTAA